MTLGSGDKGALVLSGASHIDALGVCAYHTVMASVMIRSTYALDAETVERLERLARQWSVSKSEALRRAIRGADRQPATEARLAALDALQSSMDMTDRKAEAWVSRVQEERTHIGQRGPGPARKR